MKRLPEMRSQASAMFVALLLLAASQAPAQQASVVPTLVNFGGTVTDANGKPLSDTTGVTFYLYKDQQGGAPLWLETQNVQPDKYGHYTVMLGATKSQGLPTNLFASGEARWLRVQAEGQAEQPRVMLLAVPYALKAGDAQTIGGLPPSAFVLAAPSAVAGNSVSNSSLPALSSLSPGAKPPVVGSGTQNYLPLWIDNNGDLGNSVFYQLGSGSTAKVGLNIKAPLATLDIQGTELVRGLFESATTGVATASKGFNSNAVDLEASSFNSGTNKAVMQHFEWQAEPTGNNTISPSASLNLLFNSDPNKPAETGLKISNTGSIQSTNPGQSITATMTGNNSLTAAIYGNATATGNGSTLGVQGTSNTTNGYGVFGTGGKGGVYGQGNTYGVIGNSTGGFGTYGGSVFSDGLHGLSTNGNGVYGIGATNGVTGTSSGGTGVSGTSTSGTGVYASTSGGQEAMLGVWSSRSTIGAFTQHVGVWGDSSDGFGLYGSSDSQPGILADSFSSQGVLAFSRQNIAVLANGNTFGVVGIGAQGGPGIAGVQGIYDSNSFTGSGFTNAGVWGDTVVDGSFGVLGTADDGNALFAKNKSINHEALYAENDSPIVAGNPNPPLAARFAGPGGSTYCYVARDFNDNGSGDLVCTGSKSAAVTVDGNRKVRLYAVEAADNWFEDAGSGRLSNGSAAIRFDSTFSQTINPSVEYHIFLTPKGDCEGLYVSNEGAEGFEVHELHGGHSSIAFDYRIMARRKGFENVRMQDVTSEFQQMKAESDALAARLETGKQVEKPALDRVFPHGPDRTLHHRWARRPIRQRCR